LRQIPPAQRMPILGEIYEGTDEKGLEFHRILLSVAERGAWDEGDIQASKEIFASYHKEKEYLDRMVAALPGYLDWWCKPGEFGELYLSALQAYYQVFFAEEEKRIGAHLQSALERAQKLAIQLSTRDLLVELSQGVDLTSQLDAPELVLVPLYWSTPLILWDKISPDCIMFLFGARPADAALIPGDVVPEGSLRVLKALADPTRLKILRYLSEESLTPAQLSRRLRLRPPTVTHHLSTLRLAGLVCVTLDADGNKQYASRMEAYSNTFATLGEFLQMEAEEPLR
jgi:DNA-binding transcriptional ArsR family regulator